jgi:hypothetical protein
MLINFYEIKITSEITRLHLVDRLPHAKGNDLFVKLTKDSYVTLTPQEFSKPISSNLSEILLWLIREYFFKGISQSSEFFDINKREGEFALINEKLYQSKYLSVLRTVLVRFYLIDNKFYLSILPKTGIYSRITLSKLLSEYGFNPDFFTKKNRALIFLEREGVRGWFNGYIKAVEPHIKVEVPSLFNGTFQVDSGRVIPKLSKYDFHFDKDFYQSFLRTNITLGRNSSKELLKITNDIVQQYIAPIFNRPFGSTQLNLNVQPLDSGIFKSFNLAKYDETTKYIFTRDGKNFIDDSRLKGLSKIDLSKSVKNQNIVLFGTKETIGIVRNLVSSLNNGISSGAFRFDIKSKFGIALNTVDEYVTNTFDQYLDECKKFIYSAEEKHKNALAIAYLPEHSPIYYEFKAKLAAAGKVSQIRSKNEFDIYTAWNISANLYAKMGLTPWTISESSDSESADLVLGFSYSALNIEGKLRRNIGYVNVFDKNGEWKFMRAHPGLLDFENRLKIIPELVQEAIYSFMAGGTVPKIIDIHYSKKFSTSERKKVFDAILKLLPQVQKVNFVSIDDSHSIRIFDNESSNYNLKRGNIVFLRDNEFVLSVLSNDKEPSSFRQCKIIVHTEAEKADQQNMLSIAQRILALTKLNWRSVVKDSSEPVTIKYSNEIAKLTNHFSLKDWTGIGNNLSNIPWFI